MKHTVSLSEAMAIVNSTTNANIMSGCESDKPTAVNTLTVLQKLFDCNGEELSLTKRETSGNNKIIVVAISA